MKTIARLLIALAILFAAPAASAQTIIEYKSINELDARPSAAADAGRMDYDNFRTLTDRAPNFVTGFVGTPGINQDIDYTTPAWTNAFWTDSALGIDPLYLCRDNTNGAAVWQKVGDMLHADVVVVHAAGTRTPYKATADTDLARGVALTAAIAALAAGDHIELGPDTYQVAAQLDVAVNDITISGRGNATNIVFAGIVLDYAAADKCTLKDLIITGTVEVNGSDYFILDNVEIDATGQTYGVHVHTGSLAFRMTDCRVHDAGTHNLFGISKGERWLIHGCAIYDATSDNIHFDATGAAAVDNSIANPVIISDNHVTGATGIGLYVQGMHDTQIHGNTFERNGQGIHVIAPIETVIAGNWLERNTSASGDSAIEIHIADAAALGFGNSVASIDIRNNTFQGEWRNIEIQRDATFPASITIDGNNCFFVQATSPNAADAIVVNDFDTDWQLMVVNNKVYGQSYVGNTTQKNGIKLIGQSSPTSGKSVICRGNVVQRMRTGIWVEKLTDVVVANNQLSSCTYPIRIWTNSTVTYHDNHDFDSANDPAEDGTSTITVIGVDATSGDYHIDLPMRIGDGTNNVSTSVTGDVTFNGSAGFYPRVISQDAPPASGTGATQVAPGELIFWIDTNDSNKVYSVYNNATTVVVALHATAP